MPDIGLDQAFETRCHFCQSRFRLSGQQLQAAAGKVRCGECGKVFNARTSLKIYDGKLPDGHPNQTEVRAGETSEPVSRVSLRDAMYADGKRKTGRVGPVWWLIGIVLLSSLGLAQAIYYQRYSLIAKPQYQKQILSLCRLMPCNESEFSSTRQIRLLQRSLFTHPVQPGALMITGSFVNEAVFDQKLPKLLVSLFDIQSNLIANRQFTPMEYLSGNKNQAIMTSRQPVHFRLEIGDPGTNALSYEFEFM